MNPNIYLFNATNELAIANENENYQAPKNLRIFEQELEILPIFFTQKKDIIICHTDPNKEIIENLKKIGIDPPIFLQVHKLKELAKESFLIEELKPWGWSPAIHKFFSTLKSSCSDKFKKSPTFHWNKNLKKISGRDYAAFILNQLIEKELFDFIASKDQIPIICKNETEIKNCLNRWGKIVLKAPWSSSGRGIQFLHQGLDNMNKQITLGILKKQGFIMAEPFLDKQIDFSFQFEIKENACHFLDISIFENNSKGCYQSNLLFSSPKAKTNHFGLNWETSLKKIAQEIRDILEKSEIPKYYQGILGIDAMLYKDSAGSTKIHPCIEINLRQNMGYLALQIEKKIGSKKIGKFHVKSLKKNEISTYQNLFVSNPITIFNEKIESGIFPLTHIKKDSNFISYIEIL